MEALLAQAKKVAEEAEVFMISSAETPVQFEANRLKNIQSKQSSSVALRIIKDGRVGYASATGLADNHELVNMAVETARFGMTAKFEFPSITTHSHVETFDPDVDSVPLEKMVELGVELIAQVTNHTQEIVCEAEVTRDILSVRIINSRGGEASYHKSIFDVGIGGTLIHGTDMLFVGESQSSCHPLLETKTITEIVLQQLELAKDQASVPSRQLPVVFTPNGVASALISPLIVAFNGKMVLEGASPLGNRLGEPAFDSKLWLRDDPTIAYCPDYPPLWQEPADLPAEMPAGWPNCDNEITATPGGARTR